LCRFLNYTVAIDHTFNGNFDHLFHDFDDWHFYSLLDRDLDALFDDTIDVLDDLVGLFLDHDALYRNLNTLLFFDDERPRDLQGEKGPPRDQTQDQDASTCAVVWSLPLGLGHSVLVVSFVHLINRIL
jgi:hypothetical protein